MIEADTMNQGCEGNGSIPASSFARAAAALALESATSLRNEVPDSDSSISESSSSVLGGDSEDDEFTRDESLDASSIQESIDEIQQSATGDTDSNSVGEKSANSQQPQPLYVTQLSPNTKSDNHINGIAHGEDMFHSPKEYESHAPACELTPEASNRTAANALFESDSTTENHTGDQEQAISKKLGDSNEQISDQIEDHVYNLCSTYSHSPASFADSCSFMTSPALQTNNPETSNSITTEQSSLLTRGLYFFGRKATSSRTSSNRQSSNDDASSVVSDLSHDVRSLKSSTTLRATASSSQRIKDDARLQMHLEESGLVLVKRLIEFLSACPPAPNEQVSHDSANTDAVNRKKPRGLTLPASSIGWLASQMMKCNDHTNNMARNNPDEDVFDCYQVPMHQLECLQKLLCRVTSLRLTNDKWPPPLPPILSDAADTVKRKAFSAIPETGTVSSRIFSKFSDQSSVAGINSLGEDSVSTGTTNEIAVTPFQRYFHELQYKPNIDMRMFPYASKLVVEGIPPNWISHLNSLQNCLNMFQMEKCCILDVNQLFFPSDDLDAADLISDQDHHSSFSMYKSMTKLRLSNCAISEAAGLKGRRRPRSMGQTKHANRIPTLSRFPNLESLDLSHNELFRTKTALAGLSSLPLLSSINLSYNRLSSMDTIFMHVGNVKELILTGNDIPSTRGLDRLFSLERLSLDNNKIQNLTDISSLAKLPFLMNLDIKGNPMEMADPEACRIEVFNLFREVRCKSMPKSATYRDMQQRLPILDNILATKDELVAIKNLTFRQAVPMNTAGASEIADSTEMKVDILHKNKTRHVKKNFTSRTVHCRSTSWQSDKRNSHSQLDTPMQPAPKIHVQYNIEDIIASIRPKKEFYNLSSQNLNSYQRSRTQSSFSLSNLDQDGSEFHANFFPFAVPSSLVDQADGDTWNPIPLSETLPDYESFENESVHAKEVGDRSAVDKTLQSELSCDLDLPPPDGNVLCHNSHQDIYEATANKKDTPEIDEPNQTISMFGGIWEQTYRDNVSNGATTLDTGTARDKLSPKSRLDYDVEELNAVYDGPSDYSSILVTSDLDLYFDSFVFPSTQDDDSQDETLQKNQTMPPRIQLFKFDRNALDGENTNQDNRSERYVGVWKEDVLACGSFARSRVQPIRIQKRGFHGECIIESTNDVFVSESRKIIICLSDSALYLIVNDDATPQQKRIDGAKRTFPSKIPKAATFGDAYWPHALIRHSLDCLVGITIGFQFQRLILRFSVSNTNGLTLEYTYVILTSNKLHTISLLQKLQSQVSDAVNPIARQSISIENDDKVFLESLGARTDEVVLHYQILHQVWKRGDREAARRSFVLTDSTMYLLDETYEGDGSNSDNNVRRLGHVSLTVIDSATLNRVTEVRAANEDPRMITLVIQPLNKLKRAHRWRLLCNDGEGAERIIENVRKAIRNRI